MTSTPPRINALIVTVSGHRVGMLNRLIEDRHFFTFDEDYIANPHRPTLSLSYFDEYRHPSIPNERPVSRRLPPFFSNLLPEGHLRDYLARRAGVNPAREFYVLAALGEDLPGALRIIPVDTYAALNPGLNSPPPEPATGPNAPLRFSLAGVQLKFSALRESSGGLTVPARGVGGNWILKFPSARFAAVPENEFVMLELARAIGLKVPRTQLLSPEEVQNLPPEAATLPGRVLAVERFDRTPNGERIHMEDFAQVFGNYPDDKYKGASYSNLARVILSESGLADAHEFFRRLVFSVLTGNADMHLKNWSFLYPDQQHARLSPAYDFVSTVPYSDVLGPQSLGLTFGQSRSLTTITPLQLRRFADRATLPYHPLIPILRQTIEQTRDAWASLRPRKFLPRKLRSAIEEQIQLASTNTLAAFGGE